MPRSFRPILAAIGVAAVTIMAERALGHGGARAPGAGVVESASTSASGALRSTLQGRAPGVPVRAAVLLQLADCSSNLRLFDLIHRPEVREGIALAVVWNVGAPADSTRIRPLLPRWTRTTPILPAPAAVIADLASLGHRSSPSLVMLDAEERIRLVSQSPRSFRELAGLRRAIEGLTWFEEQ